MASGQTLLIYGSMTFFNVLTRSFNQEIIRDDSDSDPIGFKFTYSCVCQIHGYPGAFVGVLPTTGDFDAANNAVAIRYLFADRQHFELRMGVTVDAFGNIASPGTCILLCDPANTLNSTDVNRKDINNGPKARVMNITHVRADSVMQVEVEFEISQLECFPDGTTGNNGGVLNNRWTVVDDIDRNFKTTRTFTGKLRLSSAQTNPNTFRGQVVPPLQQGMRREHMQFAVSEDALSLMYSITDQEVHFAPPAPATSWSARFEENIEVDGQLGFFSTADITLRGDRNVDKRKLISIASSMALAKFSNGVRLANDNSYFVQSISIVDEYSDDDSAIHLRATARRIDTTGPALLGMPSKFLGVPITGAKISDVAPSYDYTLSRGARPGEQLETAGPITVVAAFCSYLQGPCQLDHSIANGILAQQQAPNPGNPITTVSAVVNNDLPDDSTITAVYDSGNSDGMYTHWEEDVHDDTDANRAQCPIAATGTSSSQQSLGDAWWKPSDPPPTPDQQTAVPINLAPPTTTRKVILDGERVGKPPETPKVNDYTDANGNAWKVDRVKSSRQNPRYTADGKKVYRSRIEIDFFSLGAMIFGATAGNVYSYFNPFAKTKKEQVTLPAATPTTLP